jgi:hypothetical protein
MYMSFKGNPGSPAATTVYNLVILLMANLHVHAVPGEPGLTCRNNRLQLTYSSEGEPSCTPRSRGTRAHLPQPQSTTHFILLKANLHVHPVQGEPGLTCRNNSLQVTYSSEGEPSCTPRSRGTRAHLPQPQSTTHLFF